MDAKMLSEHAHEVLTRECPNEVVLAHWQTGAGMHPGLWQQIVDLGWPGLAIGEAHGGLGLGVAELAPLYEALGAAVAPLPFLSTMLAAGNIAGAALPKQAARWLPRIAAGQRFAAMLPAPGAAPALRLDADKGAWRLSGECAALLDAADADALLLLARTGDGEMMRVVVEADTLPASPERIALYDRGHSLANLSFDGFPVAAEQAYPATTEAPTLAHVDMGLAAEALGGAKALLAMTIDYLKIREQFGKPIGAFQALKHRIADHRTRLAAGDVLLAAAVKGLAGGGQDAYADCAAAKAMICADYVELARDAVQLHGGIGFTAEHACHLYMKRAWLLDQLAGGRAAAVDRAFTLAMEQAA